METINLTARYDITDRLKIEKYGSSYCAYVWYPGSVQRDEQERYICLGDSVSFQGALNILLLAYGYPVVVNGSN